MTTINIGPGFLLDMRPGGGTLADLAFSTVLSQSDSQIVLQGGGPTYTVGGVDFAGDDGNGMPTEGTVTSFNVAFGPFVIADITDMFMSWTDFWAFAVVDNYTGFLAAVFNGNDTINGEALPDFLNGYAGIDDINGNAGDDTLNGGRGGDALYGGDDNDVLVGTAVDVFNGGAGLDRLVLKGDTSGGLTLDSWQVSGIEVLRLARTYSHDITLTDGVVGGGETFTVNASLTDGHALTFDGSAESDGHFSVLGSTGNDDLTGGALDDTFYLGRGGFDTIRYTGAAQSTGTTHDTVRGFDADNDVFDLDGWVSSFNGVHGGNVSGGTFDADMGTAMNDNLNANGAIVITATGGDLIGHSFLVVDTNGSFGYEAGTDYVIDITGYTGSFDTGDFI